MEGLSPTKLHMHWLTMAMAISADKERKEGAPSPFFHLQEPSSGLRGEDRHGGALGLDNPEDMSHEED